MMAIKRSYHSMSVPAADATITSNKLLLSSLTGTETGELVDMLFIFYC